LLPAPADRDRAGVEKDGLGGKPVVLDAAYDHVSGAPDHD
jgi:hypothetical protein